MRVLLSSCLVVFAACSGFGELPPLAVGTYEGAVLGTSTEDVWALSYVGNQSYTSVLHGSVTSLRTVEVDPATLASWRYEDAQLGAAKGELLVLHDVRGAAPSLQRVDAKGQVTALDLSALFPEVANRELIDARLFAQNGQVWLSASCGELPLYFGAWRLYRLEGERFTEVPVPDFSAPAYPVAVIAGELWLLENTPQGTRVHRRGASGWSTVPSQPLYRFPELLPAQITGTGPDDAWFGNTHWNGVEWSEFTLPVIGRPGVLATKPGEARLIVLSTSDSSSIGYDGTRKVDFVADAFVATHGRLGAPERRVLLSELLNSGPERPSLVRLGDGTLVGLLSGHRLVPFRPEDEP